MRGGKAFFDPEKRCLLCYHCAATCRAGAISDDDGTAMLRSGEMRARTGGFAEDLDSLLFTRRSYRWFAPRPLDRQLLERLADISKWAPSAKNQHPVKLGIVAGTQKVRDIVNTVMSYARETGFCADVLEDYERYHYNKVTGTASTLIVGFCDSSALNPSVDTALALDYIDLALQARGGGACWGGYLVRFVNEIPELAEIFGLGPDDRAYGALMAGYPEREEYVGVPARSYDLKVKWVFDE